MLPLIRLRSMRIKSLWVTSRFSSTAEPESKKSYSDTVLLPKSSLAPSWDAVRETSIKNSDVFQSMYRNNCGTDFILHDGPPYANGPLHLGHAVNKILKDIILRHQIESGKKINYFPGWDMHGLPIELKASINQDHQTSIQKRNRAHEFSMETMKRQKEGFNEYGLCWDKDNPYTTSDIKYVLSELDAFYHMFKTGLVYKGQKPVYWSICHQTALAEAELEYNNDHVSKSIYCMFPVIDSGQEGIDTSNLFAAIWTTTPWTLVANESICFSPKAEYVIVNDGNNRLIVAKEKLDELSTKWMKTLTMEQVVTPESLNNMKYRNPIGTPGDLRPFLSAMHVTMDKGTGLVHSAPNHGKQDYAIHLKMNMKPSECVVDHAGCFTSGAGHGLQGKEVLGEGGDMVMEMWEPFTLHREDITHSYPYDWRSKKPVIIRSSNQWFIDTNKIKDEAVQSLDQIQFQPPSLKNSMKVMIQECPPWCISRQRVWGVPIPVLYSPEDKDQSNPVLNDVLFEKMKKEFTENGLNSWWETDRMVEGGLEMDKGRDILDIWFDSGCSWMTLPGDQVADLYLEGRDQVRGWFQSSLFTSIALKKQPPYKKVLVHGFTLDKDSKKMSKSVGNVIDPKDLIEGNKKKQIPPFGTDVLRYWVYQYGSHPASCAFSLDNMTNCEKNVKKIRATFKFLLGSLHPTFRIDSFISPDNLLVQDQMMLSSICDIKQEVMQSMDRMDLQEAESKLMTYVRDDLSGIYLTSLKHRLYCFNQDSIERLSAQSGLVVTCNILSSLWRPILPHLMQEVDEAMDQDSLHFIREESTEVNFTPKHKNNLIELIQTLKQLRDSIFSSGHPSTKIKTMDIILKPSSSQVRSQLMQVNRLDWADLLQAASFRFANEFVRDDTGICLPFGTLFIRPTVLKRCPRCRKYSSLQPDSLCDTCINVIKS